jgi:hypothetical protein
VLQIITVATDARLELGSAIHRFEHIMITTYKDLRLFAAVVLAHIIVWRELRRRRTRSIPQ